jgi:hypothetical protein
LYRKVNPILLSLGVLICFNNQALAQTDTAFLTHAIQALNSYAATKPIEKVHLQMDKPYYAAGDDIWFKAYVTTGSKHRLSAISGVLNVEFINNNGFVEQYIKLPMVNGLTWGDFKLPDTLSEGRYRIRAYTRFMRNADTEYFFDKTITIGNALVPKTAATLKKT